VYSCLIGLIDLIVRLSAIGEIRSVEYLLAPSIELIHGVVECIRSNSNLGIKLMPTVLICWVEAVIFGWNFKYIN
jgi:hypothetical protein